MKRIALACEDNQGLNGQMSQHFGRCPYYLIVDVEGHEIVKTDSVNNPYYSNHVPGKVPQFINDQGVNVMIAGGMGAKAQQLFDQNGIKVITGAPMDSPESLVNQYLSDTLVTVDNTCEH